jgi:hypothetical protein
MKLAQFLIQARAAEERLSEEAERLRADGWVEISPGEFISPELAEARDA